MRAALPLDRQCELAGLPVPVPEHYFARPRKWRVDWAFLEHAIAVEVEGGYAMAGRHTSTKGFLADMEKYNTLACLGWRLLRVTPRDVASGAALGWIDRVLNTERVTHE